jgi:hypothetical protein
MLVVVAEKVKLGNLMSLGKASFFCGAISNVQDGSLPFAIRKAALTAISNGCLSRASIAR